MIVAQEGGLNLDENFTVVSKVSGTCGPKQNDYFLFVTRNGVLSPAPTLSWLGNFTGHGFSSTHLIINALTRTIISTGNMHINLIP